MYANNLCMHLRTNQLRPYGRDVSKRNAYVCFSLETSAFHYSASVSPGLFSSILNCLHYRCGVASCDLFLHNFQLANIY